MQWSHYSEAIFDMWGSSASNIVVQACPGAGKTTNIAHLWGLDTKSTVYVVFNKQNQVEAQQKLPPKADSAVLTTHSLGLRAISATYGRPEIDEKKVIKLVRQYVTPRLKTLVLPPKTKLSDLEWMVKRAVDVAKFSCEDTVCDDQTYREMVNTYDLEDYEGMQEDISTVLEENDERVGTIDFSDMIRLPALYQCSMPQYDHILCDEVQDFNSMQARLIAQLQGKKYALVGDRHQSIYGFRGAMLDSMDYLTEQFQCVELPLSISYRGGKAIVDEARAVWPCIEAWDHAGDGLVRYGEPDSEAILGELRGITAPSMGMVLCRNNAPLIRYAYALLKAGIACHVRGRSIGEGLTKLVQKFPVSSIRELLGCLAEWSELELSKALVAEDDTQRERIIDKRDSLLALAQQVTLDDHPSVLTEQISELFAQGRGVVLSTVHKAKGLEAQQCYMLDHHLHGQAMQRTRTHWQREQEKNVLYVAVTRAKDGLMYC